MVDPFVASALTFLITASFSVAVHKQISKSSKDRINEQIESSNEKDRKLHIREMEHLGELRTKEIQYLDTLAAARAEAFGEGKKFAENEHQLALATALSEQKNKFYEQLVIEREAAAAAARDKERAEYELQNKLFSVKISPYAQILTDKGVVWSDYETRAGYQYQLLINGIPAFQPHVVIERHEKVKEVNPEVKKALIETAQSCAEAALKTYLGANMQFGALAPVVLDEITK